MYTNKYFETRYFKRMILNFEYQKGKYINPKMQIYKNRKYKERKKVEIEKWKVEKTSV